MVPGGLRYGTHYVVEYDSDSPWYETSLTITAEALRQGVRTEYHVFAHPPDDVRENLSRLGLNIRKLEEEDTLRILDTYDVMTGLADPEKLAVMQSTGREPYETHHHYSDEKVIIDTWRTRFIPYARVRELAMVNSFLTGVASETFYKNFEALCDGIIDLRSLEEEGRFEHYARVRTIRGTSSDSRWRRLQLLDTGEVRVEPTPAKAKALEIGLGGWLKGPGKHSR